jgi:beta-xylosidase
MATAVAVAIAAILLAGWVLGAANASTPLGVTPVTTPAIATLGAAAADSSLGLRIPFYEPSPTPDPSAPGATILAGADQPDPFIAVQNKHYYLFTSQDAVPANVPVRSATTMGQWGPMTDALPDLPPWAVEGNTWAPDIHKFGSHYILFFTAQVRYSSHIECIGNAISTRVNGPYISAPAPLICQLAQGGSIDPRTFVDGRGTPYLLWKSDDNNGSTNPTGIYSQQLSPDGEHLIGEAHRIFAPDEPWQGTIVEAPDLVLVKGVYELFYSGGWFNQSGYAIGVARCDGPFGPCGDTSPAPLLGSNAQGAGPGEESVFTDASGVWLLYTPFRSTLPMPGPPRPVALARLGFGPAGPYLAAPTSVGPS